MPEIDMNEFSELTTDGVNSDARFSHKVVKGTLNESPDEPSRDRSTVWYCKLVDDALGARREALAQEFFRLIIPHQPETRVGKSSSDEYFVLSQQVEGYHNLPEFQETNFENGTYTGLGQAMLCAMFLQEIDLKNGNVGLNDKGQVIKIDGDWCFASLGNYAGSYPITASVIEQLPNPETFAVYNWLDITYQGLLYPDSCIVNTQTLKNSGQYRAEINQAMHKICLLPDRYIELFATAYLSDESEKDDIIDLIKSRRDCLRSSALENESFRTYLTTPEAQQDKADLIKQMQGFVANGNQPIVAEGCMQEIIEAIEQIGFEEKNVPDRTTAVNIKTQLLDMKSSSEVVQSSETLPKPP